MTDPVRLTQTVKKGGCAAKVAATSLRRILSGVRFPPRIPDVLVDGSTFDDAAIVRINDDVSLVQTLDFFTPILDTPELFGRVAAANALSDVYAMGGRPQTCLAILAFPLSTFDESIPRAVLQGACDVIAEAGASLVGGHSIDDESLKFGLSVTGLVPTGRQWTNARSQAGDVLILTKPLGTGTLTAGLKSGDYSEAHIADAVDSMGRLNRAIDFLSDAQQSAIHAATDITGFALSGHAMQMAEQSGVSFQIDAQRLPVFQRTLESLGRGHLTKAHRTNREFTAARIAVEGLGDVQQLLLHDPQTSGGLLLSVDPTEAAGIVETLSPQFPGVAVIGEVMPRDETLLRFV